MGIILSSFQMSKMVFCRMDKLNMSVRARWLLAQDFLGSEMLSGLTAELGLVCSITCLVIFGVKGGVGHCWGAVCFGFFLFSCRWGYVEVPRWMRSVCYVGLIVIWRIGLCSYLWRWLFVCRGCIL